MLAAVSKAEVTPMPQFCMAACCLKSCLKGHLSLDNLCVLFEVCPFLALYMAVQGWH